MVVHANHPLARRKRVAFADTLDWEHVSLPATSAVQALLDKGAPGQCYNVCSGQPVTLRAVIALLATRPYALPLIDWGRDLHDRFALPFYLQADLDKIFRRDRQSDGIANGFMETIVSTILEQ